MGDGPRDEYLYAKGRKKKHVGEVQKNGKYNRLGDFVCVKSELICQSVENSLMKV